MRLFVAVPLPRELAIRIEAAAAPLRAALPALKWVAPANYHFTLRFLGESAASLPPRLAAELAARMESMVSLELALGDLVTLPRGPRARVLALGLARGGRALAGLAEAVGAACGELALPAERRPFRPHLTLARARQGGAIPPLPSCAIPRDSGLVWRVTDVVLYESHLRSEGPEYRVLERFGLGGSSPSGV